MAKKKRRRKRGKRSKNKGKDKEDTQARRENTPIGRRREEETRSEGDAIDRPFVGEACDYGWYGFGEHEVPSGEEDMAVVGFGKFANGGSRSGGGYGRSEQWNGDYGGRYSPNTWGYGRKNTELPAPLFINNYFNLHFTCGRCHKQYTTFSARPDVELVCASCNGEGVTTAEEVFTEFTLPANATKCGNCKLALVTEGETKYLICPKCGERMSDAKLEEGLKEVSAK